MYNFATKSTGFTRTQKFEFGPTYGDKIYNGSLGDIIKRNAYLWIWPLRHGEIKCSTLKKNKTEFLIEIRLLKNFTHFTHFLGIFLIIT